jgi:L-amino acid N-acyltransferase YncA
METSKFIMNIRQAKKEDAQAILAIYNQYIKNTSITFETEPVSLLEMEARIAEKLQKYDWLVAEVDNQIVGYAYFGPFRSRAAYQHTVESTIYLAESFKGKGYASLLYAALMDSARDRNFREMIAVIALPNTESIRFHEKMGFAEVGVMKQIGYKFGHYLDVAFLQKSL